MKVVELRTKIESLLGITATSRYEHLWRSLGHDPSLRTPELEMSKKAISKCLTKMNRAELQRAYLDELRRRHNPNPAKSLQIRQRLLEKEMRAVHQCIQHVDGIIRTFEQPDSFVTLREALTVRTASLQAELRPKKA